MNDKQFVKLTGILFVLGLVACQRQASSSIVEATCVPQVTEVTRIVPQPTFTQELSATTAATVAAISSPSIITQVGSISVQLDPIYFDGFIVLA